MTEKENKVTTSWTLRATLEVIHATHGECDGLLENFDAMKTARVGEVDSLKKHGGHRERRRLRIVAD